MTFKSPSTETLFMLIIVILTVILHSEGERGKAGIRVFVREAGEVRKV